MRHFLLQRATNRLQRPEYFRSAIDSLIKDIWNRFTQARHFSRVFARLSHCGMKPQYVYSHLPFTSPVATFLLQQN